MNKVANRFAELKKQNQKALIPYIMGGDPNLAATPRLLEILAEAGADLIEVGVAFSDPLADGPVIAAAGLRALHGGCTFEKLISTIKPVLSDLPVPVMFMAYYNMIFQRGKRHFLEEVAAAGGAGLIIPDLPPDDALELCETAVEYGIALNFLVAPNTPKNRIAEIAEASTGFVYAVSLKGVTGARAELPPELPQFVAGVKAATSKPVAVGFGIGRPEQARMVASLADGVIVGSAIVQAVAQDPSFDRMKQLAGSLKAAVTEECPFF